MVTNRQSRVPRWLRDKFRRCRNRGRCDEFTAYPDNVPSRPGYIVDPFFLDPSAWSISAVLLPTQVINGTLDIDAFLAIGKIEQAVSRVTSPGETYRYKVVVSDTVTPAGSIGVWFGNTVIWQESDGPGTFEGEITIVDISPSVPPHGYGFSIVVNGAGRAVINSIHVIPL